MHIKTLILGIIIGAALGVGSMVLFGNQIRGSARDAAQEAGQTAQDVGKTLEKAGKKLE